MDFKFSHFADGQDLLNAITTGLTGNWKIMFKRNYTPVKENVIERYSSVDFYGKDVMTNSDEYLITIFTFFFREDPKPYYHIIIKGSLPRAFDFHDYIKKYGHAPEEASKHVPHGMSNIASSKHPPTSKKNDYEGVIKSLPEVIEFIKKSITAWYFGGGGHDNGKNPERPTAPVNKNPNYSMSL